MVRVGSPHQARRPTLPGVERRLFLLSLAGGLAAALAGCTRLGSDPAQLSRALAGPAAAPHLAGGPRTPMPLRALPALTRTVPDTFIDRLPGVGRGLALTVDDGTDSAVVAAYLDFVRASGVRLTFFPNGIYPAWTEHADRLRPLVDSGQVQLGNHTWSHPNLLWRSEAEVVEQISRNERFLTDTFGVTGRPFFRPPYGAHSPRIDQLAAEQGYRVITMWYGSLGDSTVLSEAQLIANAQQWLRPQSIVIGHANHPTITHLYGHLLDLIRERNLYTVTLNDVFNIT